jgi:hypothetical protein
MYRSLERKLAPGPLAAPCFAQLPHDGDVGQESEPWAKEANSLFSQRHNKAGYGESFKR